MENKHDEITRKLMETFIRLRRLHREQKSPVEGIKHSELMVLFRIKEHGDEDGLKVSDVSDLLKVRPPTVTQLITTLEEKGLVARSIDPGDRRAIRVKLTEQGRSIIKKAFEAFFAKYSGLVDVLGEEKSLTLVELLTDSIRYLSEN